MIGIPELVRFYFFYKARPWILVIYLWAGVNRRSDQNRGRGRVTLQVENMTEITHRKTSNKRRTLVGNNVVNHSDVVGASPVGAAPTTSSFST